MLEFVKHMDTIAWFDFNLYMESGEHKTQSEKWNDFSGQPLDNLLKEDSNQSSQFKNRSH